MTAEQTPAGAAAEAKRPGARALPTGTVTFLFTDIEGSTRLLQRLGDAYGDALEDHRGILRAALDAHEGIEIDSVGDSIFVAFRRASDAVGAALDAQRALAAHRWPADGAVRVRMGIHVGEAQLSGGYYVGLSLHEAERIASAAHGGQVLLSRTARDLAGGALPEAASVRDLGLHRLKDLQGTRRIYQLLHPDLPATFPPPRSLDLTPNNLPLQLTRFIGREREIAEMKALLSDARLLTLTGAGGCGKTRLALQVGGDLLYEYPDGAWFVDLAALSDAALLLQEVAAALGIEEVKERPLLETLAAHLRPRRALVILDNCEHLVAPCADLVTALLRACPRLQIVVTTREALGVSGETAWRVPSLTLPPLDGAPPLESLLQYEAVRLFVERAREADPEFAFTQEDGPAVVQICHRLDGIPLAIELAAARVRALTPAQIAERLDDRFRLLTGGSRTALERQQTLRALVDWSYELLGDPERVLLRRLSVFASGFTLEAAEAIARGDGLEQHEILDRVDSLVAKSLVLVERQGRARYRLLETIRQYAREKLLEAGEGPSMRARHRDWFLALAERAKPELSSPRQAAWLDRLEVEHENLRAALEWSAAEESPDAELRLVGALWRFWEVRGHWVEGRARLEAALARGRTSDVRLKALMGAGTLAGYQGDVAAGRSRFEEALALAQELGDRRMTGRALRALGLVAEGIEASRALYEESLAISREVDDPEGGAAALYNLGWLARIEDDYAESRRLFEESLAISRSLGDERRIPRLLNALGSLAYLQGDFVTARAYAEESLAMARRVGSKPEIALALGALGHLALSQGELREARSLFEEFHALSLELGARRSTADALMGLGAVAIWERDYEVAHTLLERAVTLAREWESVGATITPLWFLAELMRAEGDLRRSEELHREALRLRRRDGQKAGLARELEPLGALAAARGECGRAARLFGAAEALRESLGTPVPPLLLETYARDVAVARDGLGEDDLAAAWAEGRAMPIDEAVKWALEEGA